MYPFGIAICQPATIVQYGIHQNWDRQNIVSQINKNPPPPQKKIVY